MKKRTAYIGASYPLLYDYGYLVEKSKNDLSDSPNPIIESPLGLMIFYDELLFLCRSICPYNMRNLPYVKFVDELYPTFHFNEILNLAKSMEGAISIKDNLAFPDIVKLLNVKSQGKDVHTHGLEIGDVILTATSSEINFLFDVYVFQALQNLHYNEVELITNSKLTSDTFRDNCKTELIDRIIIPGIPNYVSQAGPYHECIEELRENKYLVDFRRWVVEEHSHIQRSEIDEVCVAVEKSIEEVKNKAFRRYLNDNEKYAFFKSTGCTILKTAVGIPYSAISIFDAFAGILIGRRNLLDAESVRWQGFIIDSRDIMR